MKHEIKIGNKEDKGSFNSNKGIKGSSNGDLRIDKKEYFSRPGVKEFLKKMRDSDAYPKFHGKI